jgi:hypothetical protein
MNSYEDFLDMLETVADDPVKCETVRDILDRITAKPKTERVSREPTGTVAEWRPGGDLIGWIGTKWPGVPYEKPLQNFTAYWERTGKRKTQSNWDKALRLNPVFANQMTAAHEQMHPHSPGMQAEMDRLYKALFAGTVVPYKGEAATELVRNGRCIVVAGHLDLPWR